MKKPLHLLLLGVMIVSAIFTVWLPIYVWPKEVNTEFDGIMFEEGNSAIYETVSIELSGHLNKRMFGGERFLGKIIIDKMDVTEEWKSQTVRVNFNTKGKGVLQYLDDSTGEYSLVSHAFVSIGDNGTALALSLTGDGEEIHMFTGSTMFAGPASNRVEAVDLSNDLMRNFLENPIK